MAADKINPNFGVRGHITVWQIDEQTGLYTQRVAQPNQIQYTWGWIAAQQIGYRRQANRPDYHISAMYIEFENQPNPATPISVAAFSRDVGIGYYNSLVDSPNRDFLRIPLKIEPTLSVSSGFEANLPVDQQGNQLTFFAQTAGETGEHGKAFNAANNSKVFAVALVAAPEFESDKSKDVVFARTMFSASNQVTKEPSSQIGITWDIAFE